MLPLFTEEGIPAIPIKGPILTASVYENLALRSSFDLDILVRERDVLQAIDLIISRGYQPRDPLDPMQAAAHIRSHRAFTLDRPDGYSAVDLQWRLGAHWQIRPSFRLDLAYLWERLEPFDFAGTTVLSICPEDLLLVLCVHGCCHNWTRLKLVCDIAELVRHYPGLDWDRVIAQARALGTVRILFLGLRLAHDLLGTALPDSVSDVVLANRVVGMLVDQAHERLLDHERLPAHLFEEASFCVRTRDRLWDRLRYALFYVWAYLRPGLIPTDEDQALLPLPKPLTFLYYVIRPVRMVAKYGLRPLRRAIQNLCRPLCE